MIRTLGVDDFESVSDLIVARQQFLGVPSGHIELHREFSKENAKDILRAGPSIGNIFGYFQDDELYGALFTLISSAQPCYYVSKAYTHPSAGIEVLPSLMSSAVAHFESIGYLRFYTMYKKENHATYTRLWRTSSIMKSYISYTDLELNMHERPKFSDYWELLCGRQLYMDPMLIRGFIKKTNDMRFRL